ncbi:ABC transporter ATP-binding protein [Undibacterium sp. Di27W]|uniref:ABC transporter ATP-binding protein n=1 Tax=Undibacterium sp. Di27W TaxID=3413036 RepID=UPI003BF056D7
MSGLSLQNLHVYYGKREIIHDLSVDALPSGQLIAVLGANGCGKSSLLKALAGLIKSTGKIAFDEHEQPVNQADATVQRIVYLPQNLPEALHLTVLESVLAAANASYVFTDKAKAQRDIPMVLDLLTRLGIAHLAMQFLDQLSGGQRQLVGLAQALVRHPQVLLLDEPLSALDLNYQFHVMDLVRSETIARNMTTLIVLHDINIALRHTDHVLVIKDGRLLASGKPREVLTPALLSAAYGVRARVEACSQGIPHLLVDGLESISL